MITLGVLDKMKRAFRQADYSGDGTLDKEEFKYLLKKQLGLGNFQEPAVDALFSKIDWSSDGAITWNEFCNYMQVKLLLFQIFCYFHSCTCTVTVLGHLNVHVQCCVRTLI